MSDEMLHVLVLDDSEQMLKTIREDFALRGIGAVVARTAEEFLQKLRSERLDAVVLDFSLVPGNASSSTGLDVLREIRAYDRFIPVVVHTGVAQPDDKEELTRAGVTFILHKGCAPETLPELLFRIVGARNEIIAALELWAEENPSADEPAFAVPGRGAMTMRGAIAEMKLRSPLGRALLEQYRVGLTEMFAVGGGTAQRKQGESEGH